MKLPNGPVLRQMLVDLYLDYVNNFITLKGFAEHYGMTEVQAQKLLTVCSEFHETPHPES